MKFALINGSKTAATKGTRGMCPFCGSEVIAKCGEVKIHHWAHKGIRNCDPWWENETEWHRLWKNNFREEWQEIPMIDERTGEKHIADVRTSHDLVIEFQHSHIDPEERRTREIFYKSMVWVVDGTRLKRDYPRFVKWRTNFHAKSIQGIFFVTFPEECFPPDWLGSSVPVIFDFLGIDSIDDPNDVRNHLYCLFPRRIGRYAILVEIPREFFINSIIDGVWLLWARNLMKKLLQDIQARQNQATNQVIRSRKKVRESQYILVRGRWKKRRRF